MRRAWWVAVLLVGCSGAGPGDAGHDAGADAGTDAGPVCDPPAVKPDELCGELMVGRPCEATWAAQAWDGGACTNARIFHTSCGEFLGWRSETTLDLGPNNDCFYRDGGLVGTVYKSDVGILVTGSRPAACTWARLCSPDGGP